MCRQFPDPLTIRIRDDSRRIQNNSDREATWVIVGAPPGSGITDGIRIDPETGQEIPRT